MSYARVDEPVALRVYEALAGAGQDVWLDKAKLRAGVDWWEGVRRAIDHCVGVLFLASDESWRSMSCSQELAYAVARGKRIVPIATDAAAQWTSRRLKSSRTSRCA
jgi:TIR domain